MLLRSVSGSVVGQREPGSRTTHRGAIRLGDERAATHAQPGEHWHLQALHCLVCLPHRLHRTPVRPVRYVAA